MTSRAEQMTKDNALVALPNRQEIRKCNMRIDQKMKRPKETTYQVVLDALTLTTCYEAFLITAKVPVICISSETLEILNICPRIPGQEFSDPPFEEETLSFVRHLGHTEEIKYLTNITVDHLHQPWRALASIINKCLSGKVSDREQRCKEVRQDVLPQIYQGNHQPLSEKEPFHFNEEPAVHFDSKHEDVQVYGALMPKEMTNPKMLSSESFKTYYVIATRAEPPKSKKLQKANSSKSSKATPIRKSPWMKRAAKITFAGSKKKTKAKADTGKGLKVLSEVALSEEAQLKEVLRRSKQDFHISHASGSGDGTDERTSTRPGFLMYPNMIQKSDTESWGYSNKDNDDEEEALDKASNDDDDDDDDDDKDNDDDETKDDED
ncbi:hypothetical protein Tco_0976515 [Tanacetum coccineum]|uniref:Uncharacterized protein n=1 Tax=Tanacetum coccineum TaxID=301880 RepID=A0ABQ5EHH2_9ASTR